MNLALNKLYSIKYTSKRKKETTEREILPVVQPEVNVLALDLTDLSNSEREMFLREWEQYQKYRATIMETIFDFPDWLEHTTGKSLDHTLKWRKFAPDNIEVK